MGDKTGIAWCNHTFNPWWGCTKVSPACDRCYAEAVDARFSAGDPHWGKDAPRRFFGDKHWNEPLRWNRAAEASGERRLVFCASMADVLEDRDELEPHRQRLWALIRATRALTWLLLSKRPQNLGRMVPADILSAANVWIGTTIESPKFGWRVDALLKNAPRAAVRFLSVEPLIEEIDLDEPRCDDPHHSESEWSVTEDALPWCNECDEERSYGHWLKLDCGVSWVVAGCESGDGARETPTAWFRRLRDQCTEAEVPFLLKQAAEGAEGITVSTNVANCPAVTGNDPPFRKRDIRTGPNGIRRAHYLIERPFLDGKQHLEFPEVTP